MGTDISYVYIIYSQFKQFLKNMKNDTKLEAEIEKCISNGEITKASSNVCYLICVLMNLTLRATIYTA